MIPDRCIVPLEVKPKDVQLSYKKSTRLNRTDLLGDEGACLARTRCQDQCGEFGT